MKVRGQGRPGGAQGRARADHHHRNPVQREPRGAGGADRRPCQREDHHRTSRPCGTSRMRTRGSSLRSNGTRCRRWSSTTFTSTRRWRPVSRSMPLAIDHGRPKTLGLKELINCYIEHRREVIIRRTKFELRKAEERAETAGRLPDRALQPGRVHPHHPPFRQSRRSQDQAAGVRFHAPASGALGLIIRSETRADERALFLQRRPGRRHPGTAPLPVDRPGN